MHVCLPPQLVAINMKQQGAFVCRSLSFQQCRFDIVVQELAGTEAGEIYDKVREEEEDTLCAILYAPHRFKDSAVRPAWKCVGF